MPCMKFCAKGSRVCFADLPRLQNRSSRRLPKRQRHRLPPLLVFLAFCWNLREETRYRLLGYIFTILIA